MPNPKPAMLPALLSGLLFGANLIRAAAVLPASAPAPASFNEKCAGYLVSGAGSTDVNGCYALHPTPVCGSSPGFVLDETHTLYFYGNTWRLGLCGVNVTYLATKPGFNGEPPSQATATCGSIYMTGGGGKAPCPAVIRSNLPPVPPPTPPAPPPPPKPPAPPPAPPPWCATPGEEPPCFHNHGTK